MNDEQAKFLANRLKQSIEVIKFEYQKDPFLTKFYEAILKENGLMK